MQCQCNPLRRHFSTGKLACGKSLYCSLRSSNCSALTPHFAAQHMQIYGRGKSHKQHIGNMRLRVLIADNLKAYVESPTRGEKSKIINDVASQIQCFGGFVKQIGGGRWLSVGHAESREKVAHCFRDSLKSIKGNMSTCELLYIEYIRKSSSYNVLFMPYKA